MPPDLDPLTQFFWHVVIPGVDFHLPYEDNHQQWKDAHWHWHGGLHNGITPWIKDVPNGRYLSCRQWIMKQLHPAAKPQGIKQDCDMEEMCVNPFHMEFNGNSPRGRPRNIPIHIVHINTENRVKLLHYTWTNLLLTEEETHRQRSLPQYLS